MYVYCMFQSKSLYTYTCTCSGHAQLSPILNLSCLSNAHIPVWYNYSVTVYLTYLWASPKLVNATLALCCISYTPTLQNTCPKSEQWEWVWACCVYNTVALQCRSRSRDSDSITLDFGLQTRFAGLRLRASGFRLDSPGSGFGLRTRLQRASGCGLDCSRLWALDFGWDCIGLQIWLQRTSVQCIVNFPPFFFTFDLTVYHTCAHWHVLVFAALCACSKQKSRDWIWWHTWWSLRLES